MMDVFFQFGVTALGAVCGAYSAYRLAERRILGKERGDYLALLLVLHEHLDYLRGWLDHPAEIREDVAVFSSPLVFPDIGREQIQRLMEIAPDKDMPITLIKMLYFWRNAAKGMQHGESFCLPVETLEDIKKMMKLEMLSLRTQYEQERGNMKNFPKLEVDNPHR